MRKILVLALCCLVTACSGEKSETVAAVMQKKDKFMNCTEVKLEMNEADFYKKTAENNKGFKAKYLLMPLGYVSTYENADDAMATANSRVQYLQSIYDILGCDRKEQQMLTGPSGYGSPENNGYAPATPPSQGYAPAGGSSYNVPVAAHPQQNSYQLENYSSSPAEGRAYGNYGTYGEPL